MTQPNLPSVVETGQVLATVNDWRAMMIVFMFIIATLIGLIIWGGFIMSSLRKAIDKVADSLWALKLAIAEDRAAGQRELVNVEHERELAGAERGRQRVERKRVETREDDARDERELADEERGLSRDERKRVGDRDEGGSVGH